ncbi:uncharacterized protein L969DRAFT_76393 [Mixia osmundae IAM 14324]|uniref:AN1-type domain-containing protein n=1 Tax=Mixia osmundae (strain CBS 9802 / IAM 14324 / JCM 22182 / KY 12970) TaxID=764103 RepID=G7E0G9_MIXOS|nr:uncharacterized protein L969DRAFT_76393 [Mixia osmundae IAM 14324]KEI38338.1 hypothetical protein L969DRAFT_76393 [Mixia osmundae IAM 14324]GAA96329.1 hypothetical protein E5Q_02995 [Mixia osmundae IAM 14324]
MVSAQMEEWGAHCSEPSCSQLDFLPFRCTHCQQSFCSHHWHPTGSDGHACQAYTSQDRTVPPCPLCSTPVSSPQGQDPNIAMEQHLQTRCRVLAADGLMQDGHPIKRARPANQCHARACKTKMIVPMVCKGCKASFCPSHRFEKDHQCPSLDTQAVRPAPGQKTISAAGLAALARFKANAPASSSKPAPAANAKPTASSLPEVPAQVPASSLETTASKTAQRKSAAATVKQVCPPAWTNKATRRADSERESAMKALEHRAAKGLLTEQEKVAFAEYKAGLSESERLKLAGTSKEHCIVL